VNDANELLKGFAEFTKPESFALFLLLILPGFVTLRVYESFVPGERRKAGEALIDIIAYSVANVVLQAIVVVPLLFWMVRLPPAWLAAAVVALALFSLGIVPAAIGYGWYRFQVYAADRGWVSSPIRKPWDYIFARIKREIAPPEFIILVLTMSDGTKVCGAYVEPGFSSSYPADEQVLLGQIWQLSEDGQPTDVVEGSYGMLVDKKDVAVIEFFRVGGDGPPEEQAP